MVVKSTYAYSMIKEKILSGQLPPKSDINEKDLQEELGTSRTPVHEAILKLKEEGFVETFPRKGTFVTDVSMELVREIYEARLLIEPKLTRDAVKLVSHDWLEDIRARLIIEKPFETKDDILAVMALDTELHATVAQSCSNRFIRDSLALVYDQDRRIRLKTERNPQQVRFSQREHVVLIDAMLAGDEEKTEVLSRAHIINSRDFTYQSLGFITTAIL